MVDLDAISVLEQGTFITLIIVILLLYNYGLLAE